MTFLTKQEKVIFGKITFFSLQVLKSRSLSYDSQTEIFPLKPKRKYIVQDINGNKIQNVEKYRRSSFCWNVEGFLSQVLFMPLRPGFDLWLNKKLAGTEKTWDAVGI